MLHLLVLLQVVIMLFTAGPRWHFHSAVKQNASGSKSVKYQHECAHVCCLPIPDGSATWPTCQRTTRVHLSVELLIIICSLPPYLLFNFFLHEQQLSMRWHFNSTTKSPQHIYLRELIKSLSSRFPSHCFPAYFPFPSLITKDMVIIAGGGKGQKEGTCLQSTNRGKRHLNVYPDKWALGHNSEVCHWHLVNWREPACLILTVRMHISLWAGVVVVSTSVLGSASGQTEGGYCALQLGHVGAHCKVSLLIIY